MSAIVEEESKQTETVVDNRNVRLVSKDGESFELPVAIAKLSKMVATGIEGTDENETPEITLNLVRSAPLAKIVEFLNHHAEEPVPELPKPLKTNQMKDAVSEWYVNFLTMEHEPLFELILAANFMDISPLLEMCCAAVACQIKDKRTPQAIAAHFGIKREYKEPDPKRIKETYPWSAE
eukprot:TRINITY_DN5701_c0_g1_i1.p1 TRINITY_DN5701_c0_g1~~TRINITY_DN5701_c0_g1_i1.p1  ORF type:complete len:179 (+),score=14.69 TRINITY_DN5701_c0_g1_i1:83-619(+)